jgi:hypothetical protein
MSSQIARRVASHFALSISVRKSPRLIVNLLLISSIARSNSLSSERFSAARLFMSISILLVSSAHPRFREEFGRDLLVLEGLDILLHLLFKGIDLATDRTGHCA